MAKVPKCNLSLATGVNFFPLIVFSPHNFFFIAALGEGFLEALSHLCKLVLFSLKLIIGFLCSSRRRGWQKLGLFFILATTFPMATGASSRSGNSQSFGSVTMKVCFGDGRDFNEV